MRNDRGYSSTGQYKLNRDQTRTFLKVSVLHGQGAQSSQATALQPLVWPSAQGEFQSWVL